MRDALPDLKKMNVAAVGISPDPPKNQKRFDEKTGLGFPLLSDEDHAIAEAYGAWAEKKLYGKIYKGIVRSSFLIGEDGKIVETWYKISPKDTIPELMKVL